MTGLISHPNKQQAWKLSPGYFRPPDPWNWALKLLNSFMAPLIESVTSMSTQREAIQFLTQIDPFIGSGR